MDLENLRSCCLPSRQRICAGSGNSDRVVRSWLGDVKSIWDFVGEFHLPFILESAASLRFPASM